MPRQLLFFMGCFLLCALQSCFGPNQPTNSPDTGAIPNYRAVKLLPLSNDVQTRVYAINNADPPVAVGASLNSQGKERPVFWVLDNLTQVQAHALQRNPAFPFGEATAISESGMIAGTAVTTQNDRVLPVWWGSTDDFPNFINLAQTNQERHRYMPFVIADDTVVSGRAMLVNAETGFKLIARTNNFHTSYYVVAQWAKTGPGIIDRVAAGYRLQGLSLSKNAEPMFGLSEAALTMRNTGFERTELHDLVLDTILGNVLRMQAPGFKDFALVNCAGKRPRKPLLYTMLLRPGLPMDTSFIELPMLAGDSSTWVTDMNRSGYLVGSSIRCLPPPQESFSRGVIWTASSGMRNINDFLVTSADLVSIEENTDINEAKLITANGTLNGIHRAFVLVPESPRQVDLEKRAPVSVRAGDIITYTFTVQNFTTQAVTAIVRDPIPNGTVLEPGLPQTHIWSQVGNEAVSAPVVVPALGARNIELKLRVTAPAGSMLVNNFYSIQRDGQIQTFDEAVFTQVTSRNSVVVIPVSVPGSSAPGGSGGGGNTPPTQSLDFDCANFAPNSSITVRYEVRGTVEEPSVFSIVDVISNRTFYNQQLPPFEDASFTITQDLFLDPGQYEIVAMITVGAERFISPSRIFTVGLGTHNHDFFTIAQLEERDFNEIQPQFLNSTHIAGTVRMGSRHFPALWRISGELDTVLTFEGFVQSFNAANEMLVSNGTKVYLVVNLEQVDSFPVSASRTYFDGEPVNLGASAALLNDDRLIAGNLHTQTSDGSFNYIKRYIGVLRDSIGSASWINRDDLLADVLLPQPLLLSNNGQMVISRQLYRRDPLNDTVSLQPPGSGIGGDLIVLDGRFEKFRFLTPYFERGRVLRDSVLQCDSLPPVGNFQPALVNGINDRFIATGAVGFTQGFNYTIYSQIGPDTKAALWYGPPDGQFVSSQSLQQLGTAGIAQDINNTGTIVGTFASQFTDNTGLTIVNDSASVYFCGSQFNLNGFIPANTGAWLRNAFQINDKNCILSVGTFNQAKHYYILIPRNRAQ